MPGWTSKPQDCSRGWRARSGRARERLLEQLAGEGVGIDELKAAVAEERLALLPVERVLGGNMSARRDRAADRGAGERDAPHPAAARPARGRPRGPRLHRRGRRGREVGRNCSSTPGSSEEAIAEITRVLGEGMSRLAATITAHLRRHVPRARRHRGGRGAAIPDARRAADPGAHSSAGGGVQRAAARGRQPRRARPRRARVRGDRRTPRSSACASRTWSASPASAGRSASRGWARSRPGSAELAAETSVRTGASGQDDRRRRDVRQPRDPAVG